MNRCFQIEFPYGLRLLVRNLDMGMNPREIEAILYDDKSAYAC